MHRCVVLQVRIKFAKEFARCVEPIALPDSGAQSSSNYQILDFCAAAVMTRSARCAARADCAAARSKPAIPFDPGSLIIPRKSPKVRGLCFETLHRHQRLSHTSATSIMKAELQGRFRPPGHTP